MSEYTHVQNDTDKININEVMNTIISKYQDMGKEICDEIMKNTHKEELILKSPSPLYSFIENPEIVIKRMKEILSGIFNYKSFDWTNIAVAGGFMVQCANKTLKLQNIIEYIDHEGDVDFYIYGVKNEQEFDERVRYIYEQIEKKTTISSIMRTKNAFTINTEHERGYHVKIQIILAKLDEIKNIFGHYDIKICCMAFDGSKFILSNAAYTMATERCLVVNCAGPTVPYSRVLKYFMRGFNLHFINFTRKNIKLDKICNIYNLINITPYKKEHESYLKSFREHVRNIVDISKLKQSDYLNMMKINPCITNYAFKMFSEYSITYKSIYRELSKKTARELISINDINNARASEIINEYLDISKGVNSDSNGEKLIEKKLGSISDAGQKFDKNVVTLHELTKFINTVASTNDSKNIIIDSLGYFSDKPLSMKYRNLEDALHNQIKYVSRGDLLMVCGTGKDFEDVYAGRIPKKQFNKIINDWANAYMNKYIQTIDDLDNKIAELKQMERYIFQFQELTNKPLVLIKEEKYSVLDLKEKIETYEKWY